MVIYLQMIEDDEDRTKFERIYYSYEKLMFYTAGKMLTVQEDKEDAVYQAFVKIIEIIKKIKLVDSPETKALIVKITEQRAIDILRKNQKTVPIGEDISLYADENEPQAGSNLVDALEKMNPRYKNIIMLRYDQGFSVKEIAKLFNMKETSVQKVIWRAKESLRRYMEGGETD